MTPISYYTTISAEAEAALEQLNDKQLHYIIVSTINEIVKRNRGENPRLTEKILNELLTLSDYNSYGLIKALCNRCQDLLLTKYPLAITSQINKSIGKQNDTQRRKRHKSSIHIKCSKGSRPDQTSSNGDNRKI